MKNVKKIIEVKLMGLNELGVKELNDFYKDNIEKGYMEEFSFGDDYIIKKKRFKQFKEFDRVGLENYITTFNRTKVLVDEGEYKGIRYLKEVAESGRFALFLKHFNHEIYEIEIIEVITKRD